MRTKRLGGTELVTLVNDKMNGYAVVDKSACSCLHGNIKRVKAVKLFRSLLIMEKSRSRE